MPQFFIDRPVFAWVVALFILLAGALSIPQLPVAQYPDVAPPSIEIYAVYPGASAQTVDESVVSLIEEELNGADHLLYFSSQSSLGSATITATFQPGTNPEMAQVDVQNRLKVVEPRLPQAVTQQGLQVEKVSAGFLLLITLTSNDGKLDDTALSDYLARNVMNEIRRLDGVGKAQLYGAERAMRVWIDPQKLIGFNLTPADVNAAIVAQNAQVSAGSIGDLRAARARKSPPRCWSRASCRPRKSSPTSSCGPIRTAPPCASATSPGWKSAARNTSSPPASTASLPPRSACNCRRGPTP
ncbi:hypothetical protein TRE132_35710 [Pseudomonas chlororaphis subsp. aurantiaca]|nr:hypothetical protein TRE132_35710 [Pseudomonas chlororaphis subsp. aurantiaca]